MPEIKIKLDEDTFIAFGAACKDRKLTPEAAVLKMVKQVVRHDGHKVALVDAETGEHIGGPKVAQ